MPPPENPPAPAEPAEDDDVDHPEASAAASNAPEDPDEDDPEEEEEEEEEPRLKYTRLTRHLGAVYRNGDAVSASLVFGERMVVGTHNGNIHILSLPSLRTIRTYHAHSASVTSISISPPPPPPNVFQPRNQKNDRNIFIATSGIDGLVVIVPLLPSAQPQPGQNPSTMSYAKAEITVKNFKRPILAVALSPNFRTDRTFLSGGLAGNLVLSIVPLASSGGSWMTLGMGGGKDTVLHSGEGAISAIAWSKESPRFVTWTNEQGIKIMRSHIIPPNLHKQGSDEIAGNPGVIAWIPGLGVGGRPVGEVAWKRISAFERPDSIPEELASVHKPRLQWIDRRTLSTDSMDDVDDPEVAGARRRKSLDWGDKERLLVGWGNTVWIMDVFAGTGSDEAKAEERRIGWAELIHILQTDCTISGLHMYTPSLLLMLAYLAAPEETATSGAPASSSATPPFRRGRANALTPELRLIDIHTSEEVSADELTMSRFEGLSPGDYHLGVLPVTPSASRPTSRSAAGDMLGIGGNIWAAGVNATDYFISAATLGTGPSIKSSASIFGAVSPPSRQSLAGSGASTLSKSTLERARQAGEDTGWGEDEKGTKIYITSPYDVVFATERSAKDHVQWELERERYEEAWNLVDKYPEIAGEDAAGLSVYDEEERRVVEHTDDGYETDSTISGEKKQRSIKRYSAAEKEKRRIGELWLKKLIKENEWERAGEVCGKVLGTSTRWEHWVWVFEAAGRIQEITPYIPRKQLAPPLPSVIYEIVLAHYLNHDRRKFRELLLETWQPERSRSLYDPQTIIDAIIRKLDNQEDDVQDGDDDWKLLQECLAKLYMFVGDPRNALRRYIILRFADEAFSLIREYRLVDTIRDNIPSVILLRVTPEQLNTAGIDELESVTTEAITLLVDEADRGIVSPQKVVSQLQDPAVTAGNVFLFFYLRRLWRRERTDDRAVTANGGGLLTEFGDLMVELFAEYDRPLLMEFLRDSHTYSLEKASTVCEQRNYIPELVHLLSKTGQTKRALFLIIDKLADVQQAIAFAKAQDDPDLWNDLLDYSMDKPPFIRGLLENVGTAIDPITLVRRIPAGLHIEGLKPALRKILKEYGVQWSICDGVAKALRSEVARGMDNLRGGQRRGVKFQVGEEIPNMPGAFPPGQVSHAELEAAKHEACGKCRNNFVGNEHQTLIAFACGHVFHIRCLVPQPEDGSGGGDDSSINADQRPRTGGAPMDDEYEPIGYGRSVATKVTHAALIRDKVKKGCPVCLARKEAEVIV